MKWLIVLTIALVAVVAAKPSDNPIDVDGCIAQTGITPDQLLNHNRGQHSDEKEVHDYVLCILKQANFFTEENGFNVEQMVDRFKASHLDEAKARELAAKCLDRNEKGSTPAVWGYRGVQCLSDNKIKQLLSEARRKFRDNE